MGKQQPAATLLLAAIEDNIGWCRAVCAAHGSDERISAAAWINLASSPPYYPNIITRQPGAQAEIAGWIEAVRKQNAERTWGIKDSFHDLDLTALGFNPVIEGGWFGSEPIPGEALRDWDVVRDPAELALWEWAWSEAGDHRIFVDALRDDPRIKFWMLRQAADITAGCISFSSGPVIGLSNWFSKRAETVFDHGIRGALAETANGRPVVFWASEEEAAPAGFNRLGSLRVWLSI